MLSEATFKIKYKLPSQKNDCVHEFPLRRSTPDDHTKVNPPGPLAVEFSGATPCFSVDIVDVLLYQLKNSGDQACTGVLGGITINAEKWVLELRSQPLFPDLFYLWTKYCSGIDFFGVQRLLVVSQPYHECPMSHANRTCMIGND
ncbi:hypothetical protein Tco_1300481 [Tanacetum coccineum]